MFAYHYSGLGNYDVNVVTAALLAKHCDVIWFDRRKDPSIIKLGTKINKPLPSR